MQKYIKGEYSHIDEELWCLIHNKKFQQEVRRLRDKYGITKNGIKDDIVTWIDTNWVDNKKKTFEIEMSTLLLRCKGSKSSFYFRFNSPITAYVLSNKLQRGYYGFSYEYENVIKYDIQRNKVKLTLLLGFDATKELINEILIAHWKSIENLQKQLVRKKFRASQDFQGKVKLWEGKMIKNKTEDELADSIENDVKYYSKNDIKNL